jgi:hypothetical protein
MNGVINAPENIYAVWQTDKELFIEKVIAFHYDCSELDAYLKPICLNKELSSDCSEQIIFYGKENECIDFIKNKRSDLQ